MVRLAGDPVDGRAVTDEVIEDGPFLSGVTFSRISNLPLANATPASKA